MDGIETLRQLRRIDAGVAVVMFSSLTERGARATFDALDAGASDYVTKPSSIAGESLDGVVRDHLRPKLLAVARVRRARGTVELTRSPRSLSPPLAKRLPPAVVPPAVVVIASSTGGPNALAQVLPHFAASLPVPILIVQHMPPVFTRCLAERLAASCPLRVVESQGGETVAPGTIFIAPGGKHLEVVRDGAGYRTVISDGPPESSCKPAADVLFRSATKAYGAAVLAVVLTGMGQDGLAGSELIVRGGGSVIAQDRASCVVWGMPKAIEEAGIASAVVPLSDVAATVTDRVVSRATQRLALREGAR